MYMPVSAGMRLSVLASSRNYIHIKSISPGRGKHHMKHLKSSPLNRKRYPCSFPPHLSAVPYDESMLGILRNRSSLYVIGRTVCILGGTDIRDARRRVAVEHLASPCHGQDSIKRQSISQTVFYIEKWMAQITDSF